MLIGGSPNIFASGITGSTSNVKSSYRSKNGDHEKKSLYSTYPYLKSTRRFTTPAVDGEHFRSEFLQVLTAEFPISTSSLRATQNYIPRLFVNRRVCGRTTAAKTKTKGYQTSAWICEIFYRERKFLDRQVFELGSADGESAPQIR